MMPRMPITPEIIQSRRRDMETVLDDYRENLHDRGVTDEKAIDRFVSEERKKMIQEYESLDNGDFPNNNYCSPTDWDKIADGMKSPEVSEEQEEDEGMSM